LAQLSPADSPENGKEEHSSTVPPAPAAAPHCSHTTPYMGADTATTASYFYFSKDPQANGFSSFPLADLWYSSGGGPYTINWSFL